MTDKNNNKNNSSFNQINNNKKNLSKSNKIKKVEKLQPKLYKESLAFTQLLNETINAINDAELLGIYCYLASKPEEWNISKTQLRNHFNIGLNKMDSIFTKLKSLGLLEMIPFKNKQGKIIHWDYFLKMRTSIPMETIPMETIPMETIPMETRGMEIIPPINIYIKKNKNKESNTFSITKENEFDDVIQKAQECLEKTKENLPSTSSEIVPYTYQETNLPALKKSTTLIQLEEINSLNLPSEFLEQLILIRKANKASVNKKAMQAVYQELIKLKNAGLDLNECLNMYANCGWKGFVADWFINSMVKKPSTHLDHDSIQWGKDMESDPFYQNLDWIK
jgi:hypothetical protein